MSKRYLALRPWCQLFFGLLATACLAMLTSCKTESADQPTLVVTKSSAPSTSTTMLETTPLKPAATSAPDILADWEFESVHNLTWSPDSKHLLITWVLWTDIYRPSASLYDLKTIRKIWESSEFGDDAVYQPDGKVIISIDNSLRSWDALTGKFLNTLYGPGNGVLHLSFLPGGTQMLLGRAFYGGENALTEIGILNSARKDINILVSQSGGLTNLIINPDGKEFLTIFANTKNSSTNMVFLWTLATGQMRCSFPGDDADFIPGGEAIVVITRSNAKINIYDARTCKSVNEYAENHYISVFSISPDGGSLAYGGGQDGAAYVIDLQNNKPLVKLDGGGSAINKIAFSPNGQFLVISSSKLGEKDASHDIVRVWKLVP